MRSVTESIRKWAAQVEAALFGILYYCTYCFTNFRVVALPVAISVMFR